MSQKNEIHIEYFNEICEELNIRIPIDMIAELVKSYDQCVYYENDSQQVIEHKNKIEKVDKNILDKVEVCPVCGGKGSHYICIGSSHISYESCDHCNGKGIVIKELI